MKKFFTFIIIITIFIFIFLIYSGLFTKVHVQEKTVGPHILVYQNHKGSYKAIGTVLNKVYRVLNKKFKIKATHGFGIFYDKPGTVKEELLRSEGGVILDSKYKDKIDAIRKKLKVKKYPSTKSVVVIFPYKNQVSYILGPIKAYPVIQKYMKKKGYKAAPALEIYDIPGRKILYSMPIRKKK